MMRTWHQYLAAAAMIVSLGVLSPFLNSTYAQEPPPGSSPFTLEARVSPPSAPIGEPFAFSLTITNTTTIAASFTVDGCPVHYRIDGTWSPYWGCEEYENVVTLDPGQSITFSPEENPRLLFNPHDYPLGPGFHRVVLATQGVGAAEVEFEVEPASDDLAYLAGTVVHPDGTPVRKGLVSLSTGFTDDLDGTLATPISDQGHFLFAGVPSGGYLLRVHAEDRVLWYPGVVEPLMAERIALDTAEYRGDIEFLFGNRNVHVLEGLVNEVHDVAEGKPLAYATVAAIPVWPDAPDSAWDGGALAGSAEDAGRAWGVQVSTTDGNGRFHLELPEGIYRLAAGKLGSHRYQYWNHVGVFTEAELMRVPDPTMRPQLETRFDLARLGDAALATLSGQVLAYDPVHDGPPEPVAGAEVVALPSLSAPEADIAPQRTRTDEDGFFVMEVPADAPYLLLARAEGFESRFYRNAVRPRGATWVDVAPGKGHDGLDFVLQPRSSNLGAITGLVYHRIPEADCLDLNGERCYVPAAGALVRVTPAFPTFAPTDVRTRVNRDGSFRVDGLVATSDGSLAYFVSAELEGGESGYYPGGVPFAEAALLPVLPGKTSSAGRIVLRGSHEFDNDGFVGGWVTGPDGKPIGHAVIRVYVDSQNPRGRVVSGRTDAEGYFLIKDLPAKSRVLVAAAAEGWIPSYYPGVLRWKEAEPVPTGGPNVRVPAVRWTLEPVLKTGPYLQAGRVQGEGEDGSFTGPILSPNHHFIRGAFFYLVEASGLEDLPVAGGATGDNGTIILTGLPGGTYFAVADRPGFEPGFFVTEGEDRPSPLRLDDSHAALLADIWLRPEGAEDEVKGPGDRNVLVTQVSNVPNPFRPLTSIRYTLEIGTTVTVQIFDYRGRMVRTLIEAEAQEPGVRQIPWDGRGDDGNRVSSGVYFYRIQAGETTVSNKMVVLP